MQRFEYHTLEFDRFDHALDALGEILRHWGNVGWRVCQTWQDTNDFARDVRVFLLERTLEGEPPCNTNTN